MAVKIIEATDPIEVTQVVMVIIGPHGIGKSTLGYTADEPLSLGFDDGYYRAQNRRRTVDIAGWSDVGEVMAMTSLLEKHRTVTLDTGGRALDMLSAAIIADNAKNGNGDGTLSQKGWGCLKNKFVQWQKQVKLLGKDIVIICHEKETDGKIKADLQGGSYGEVMKSADFIGYLYVEGGKRWLDFSPTEARAGKNPAGWDPIEVPHFVKEPRFLANLIADGKRALGRISEESAAIASKVADWQTAIGEYKTLDELNGAIPKVKELAPPILLEQVKRHLGERAKGLGFKADKTTGLFRAAEEPQAATA